MIFKVTHLCLKPSGGAMSLGRAIPFFWLVGVCVCVFWQGGAKFWDFSLFPLNETSYSWRL